LGVIPCQGASIEPYEALVAQGIASMVGVAQSFQLTALLFEGEVNGNL